MANLAAMQERDPFAVLGVSAQFDLDLTALAERHRELSRSLHPDRHANAAPGERREALSRAIGVNEAWRALKDPISRAQALLQHLGVPEAEGSEPKASESMLFEIMEAREELGELRAHFDEQRASKLSQRFDARQQVLLSQLTSQFENLQRASLSEQPALADTVRRTLGELRFVVRLLSELAEVEDR